jgi:hypothetical protein
MKKIRNCKHCYETFESRRSNHVYCTQSCKTKASYERNSYKYVSGHYKKVPDELQEQDKLMAPNLINNQIQELESKVNSLVDYQNETKGINATDIGSSALGTLAADGTVHVIKKLFIPQSLPATKGDIEELKTEINNLKFLLKMKQRNF